MHLRKSQKKENQRKFKKIKGGYKQTDKKKKQNQTQYTLFFWPVKTYSHVQ